jgi:hypothetical protein
MRKFLLLAAIAAMVACEQDVYDKGEGKYSLLRADFAEAHVTGSQVIDYIVTDDGDQLMLTKPYTAQWLKDKTTGARVLVYYNRVDDQAEAVSISEVPSLVPHRSSSYKTGIKTDPVGFESAWLSRNGSYLNFCIVLMVGTSDDTNATHTLDIVSDTIVTHADRRTTSCLQLYHDQGTMPEYYSYRTFFSIPLQAFATDSVRMTINTYQGPVVKTFCIVK